MKKILMSVLLFSGMVMTEYVAGNLVVNNMVVNGNAVLSGSEITHVSLNGSLEGRSATFGTITGNGTVILKSSTADAITLSNPTIGPSDTPITLDASIVAQDVTFTGAYGTVLVKNGGAVNGSVINGHIVNG